MTRHEAREVAFIIIFEKMFQEDITAEDMFSAADESGLFSVNGFAKKLVKDVLDNMEEIDDCISENLVRWSAQRISKVSRAILRLAVGELKHSDIPVGIAINEAVEIAKKYSTEQDASYINGVLASVAKKVRN